MSAIKTFPTLEQLEERAAKTPDFMRPNTIPFAAYIEGFLKDEECSAIIRRMHSVEPHSFRGCDAETREIEFDPVLDPIEATARALNELFWGFDLDDGQHSFCQTYTRGDRYQRHMDGSPGQNRKLTAVALLTDPSEYEGGLLRLYYQPVIFPAPRTRGTILVFPSWLEHEVLPITSGRRQTVNMGFWGPQFR